MVGLNFYLSCSPCVMRSGPYDYMSPASSKLDSQAKLVSAAFQSWGQCILWEVSNHARQRSLQDSSVLYKVYFRNVKWFQRVETTKYYHSSNSYKIIMTTTCSTHHFVLQRDDQVIITFAKSTLGIILYTTETMSHSTWPESNRRIILLNMVIALYSNCQWWTCSCGPDLGCAWLAPKMNSEQSCTMTWRDSVIVPPIPWYWYWYPAEDPYQYRYKDFISYGYWY